MQRIFSPDPADREVTPAEGELFKVLEVHGGRFEIYYGYYEECERNNPVVDPMPIYPDFTEQPQYTADGFAYVTKMQDACRYYEGKPGKFNDCAECQYYLHGDELLGICTCPKNKRVTHPKNSQEEAK